MTKTILYDIPTKGQPTCWSPNTWKTRLALNFKEIDYETRWVEYPDIKSTISPHVSPNEGHGSTPYTLPVVQFSDDTWIMGSEKIAERLEKDHPSPSLRMDGPIVSEVESTLLKCKTPLRGVWLPRVPDNLLNKSSKDYFYRTREEVVGKSLQQYHQEQGGEEAWLEALPGIKGLGLILQRNEGPFVLGKSVSYADFAIVGYLHFLKLIDEEMYHKMVQIEPTLETLYNSSKKWLERDSH